jgi:hypothetical protein
MCIAGKSTCINGELDLDPERMVFEILYKSNPVFWGVLRIYDRVGFISCEFEEYTNQDHAQNLRICCPFPLP